jgi:hypothetical protein
MGSQMSQKRWMPELKELKGACDGENQDGDPNCSFFGGEKEKG